MELCNKFTGKMDSQLQTRRQKFALPGIRLLVENTPKTILENRYPKNFRGFCNSFWKIWPCVSLAPSNRTSLPLTVLNLNIFVGFLVSEVVIVLSLKLFEEIWSGKKIAFCQNALRISLQAGFLKPHSRLNFYLLFEIEIPPPYTFFKK